MSTPHLFHAVAFAENLSLKEVALLYPTARRSPYELHASLPEGGDLFVYSFGAMVFREVPPERRDAEIARVQAARTPRLAAPVAREDFSVRDVPSERPRLDGGVLSIDRLTPERAGVVALTVAQSAAMEYYERIVDTMFARTGALVERLERAGTVSLRTRPLHRFIGEALGARNEVLAVLHLLDKPDATWDDPVMSLIYDDLRAEFDLSDRYGALTSKLRGIQESLELVLDVARDRRLVLLETTVVLLIVFEIVLALTRG